MYARTANGQIAAWPVEPAHEHPDTRFPTNLGGGTVKGDTYVPLAETTPPAANVGWSVVETTPTLANGSWQRTYAVQVANAQRFAAELANLRWRHEVAGVTVDSFTYDTDRESQSKYIGSYVSAVAAPNTFTTVWKTEQGFVNLNANGMIKVAFAVRDYVQACYANEYRILQLVNAANADLTKIDLTVGWPSSN